MTDVAFDGADDAGACGSWRIGPELGEAVEFDGVTDGGAGAVTFDEIDIVRIPAGLLVGGAHGAELAGGIGEHEVAADVVGEADAGEGGVDAVTVAEGVGEALEDEDAGPFPDDESIGFLVEGGTTATR